MSSQHPYKKYSDYAFWNRSIGRVESAKVDPVVNAPFTILDSDRVATAGSCFAQHIARYLKKSGFNYFVTETAHPITPLELVEKYCYGTYSARYGNIYTSRQLLQLWKRAFGEFIPVEDIWESDDGNLIDPFRPQIQPDGFPSMPEYEADRQQHYAFVRQLFSELDVFVFTLGLTECWASKEDGAVYPLCPGVAGGIFDSQRYKFLNLSVDEVVTDMLDFIDRLRAVNNKAKIILTVSPVPLMATAVNRHVLVSTTYSKSVLRVAAETISVKRENVAYFPSYEIITGNFSRGRYYAEDLRSVTEEGVNHVMRLFMKHYAGVNVNSLDSALEENKNNKDDLIEKMAHLVEVNCDEAALDADSDPKE